MDVLDYHAHINPPAYLEALDALSARDPSLDAFTAIVSGALKRFPLAYGEVPQRLELMDAAGISVEYLSMCAPYPHPSDPAVRAEVFHAWNEAAVGLADQHPGRFKVLLSVPLPDVPSAIAETEKMIGAPHVAGVMINTHTEGIPVDDPGRAELYQLWHSLKTLVFLHPDGFCVRGLLEDDLNWDIGTQLDDTIAAARLISRRVPARYPGIRWIVPHLGGTLPFILGRMDQHWERDRADRPFSDKPSESLDRLFFDTAGHNTASIRFAIDVLGAERIVFGSDFPMVGTSDLAQTVDSVARACSSQAQRDELFRKKV